MGRYRPPNGTAHHAAHGPMFRNRCFIHALRHRPLVPLPGRRREGVVGRSPSTGRDRLPTPRMEGAPNHPHRHHMVLQATGHRHRSAFSLQGSRECQWQKPHPCGDSMPPSHRCQRQTGGVLIGTSPQEMAAQPRTGDHGLSKIHTFPDPAGMLSCQPLTMRSGSPSPLTSPGLPTL